MILMLLVDEESEWCGMNWMKTNLKNIESRELQV